MTIHHGHLILILFVFANASQSALACSSFAEFQTHDRLIAKSFDWEVGVGHMVSNPRGLHKQALIANTERNKIRNSAIAVEWRARFASLTFNQFGKEFPYGGMNEKGLVVEILNLADTQWAEPDEHPEINDLQVIQYLLDTSADLDDVKINMSKVRLVAFSKGVQYFVCDLNSCLAISLISGALNLTPIGAIAGLANSRYSTLMKYAEKFTGFGGSAPIPDGDSSFARFVRGGAFLQSLSSTSQLQDMFSLLDEVVIGTLNKWRIVYSRSQSQVHLQMNSVEGRSAGINFVWAQSLYRDCDQSLGHGSQFLDMQKQRNGDLTLQFIPFSASQNEALVREAALKNENHLGSKYPAAIIDGMVNQTRARERCLYF